MRIRKYKLRGVSEAHGREVNPEDILLDALNPEEFNTDRLEGQLEFSLGRAPFFLGLSIAILGILVLAARVGFLQIVKGEVMAKRAAENRVTSIRLPAPRGLIYDRNREELVKNTPSFEVVLKRDEVPESEIARRNLAMELGELFGKTAVDLEEAGFDADIPKENLPEEIVVASDVSREEVVEVESRPADFPGVLVRERQLREYPGSAFLHVLGYIGKVSMSDLKEHSEYRISDLIGKSGIEATYETELRGVDGEKLVEINSSHAAIGDLPELAPRIGNSSVLNIDAELQRVLYDSLTTHLREHGKTAGSAVVIDPRDGAVRALVSVPSFDPNLLRRRLTQSEYEKLILSKSKPFFNRAIAGEYPSGSVIKPMVAVAALEEKVIDPTYKIYDSGSISIPNPYKPGEETIFPDWKAHGWVDLRGAIQWSANVYFYIVGGGYKDIKGLGITKLDEYMKKFGLGSKLGIDLPGETEGLVPGLDNIALTRPKDPVWRLGDTYHAAIGQGSFQATPLQIVAMTAAVANGGTLWQPQVVRAILDPYGNVIKTIEPKIIRDHLGDPRSFEIVRQGMRLVATQGTARNFFADFPVEVAGKTGTAQTGFQKNAHGWFTVFAPYKDPELAMVVMAEDVIENTSIATPVTRDVLYWYFTQGPGGRAK
ncbi:MAG: penicillin-binding protein 2 [Candidatus Sungbacteria bacterium]|nr:penicillin-binding protein 2 [Candidatus Sungbacteria bacterium]